MPGLPDCAGWLTTACVFKTFAFFVPITQQKVAAWIVAQATNTVLFNTEMVQMPAADLPVPADGVYGMEKIILSFCTQRKLRKCA